MNIITCNVDSGKLIPYLKTMPFPITQTYYISHAVVDLGESPVPPPPPRYFGLKKEEMTEGKKTSRASKSRPGPPLAQDLDPPLLCMGVPPLLWVFPSKSIRRVTLTLQ